MKKKTIIIITIATIILLFAATLLTQVFTNNKLPNETGYIKVHFCPQENCETILANTLNEAEHTINCAFYDFNLKEPIKLLKEKDVQTQIIIDRHNFKKVKNNQFTIEADNPALMHNKFCIIDKKIILAGSMNPTTNGATKNNNNLIIINSTYLAKNYQNEFNEMKKGYYGRGKQTKHTKITFNNKTIENYFCPEDNCEEKTITFLNSAKESIQFMTFSFTSGNIANTLKQKQEEGIKVQGLMETRRLNMQYNQYKNLNSINITPDTNPHIMHHKVFIVDNKAVLTGSYNPTKAGNTKNDENILIIHDKAITTKFVEEFNTQTFK
jgi:phosphatidylserine/phosphatidylglycerophosphate/cardiolipin synthase-like enzyme